MKKIIAILATMSLLFSMIAATTVSVSASSADVPEYIRVGIKSATSGYTYTLGSSTGFKIYSYNTGGTCTPVMDLLDTSGEPYTSVYVYAGDTDVIVTDTSGNTLYSAPNNSTSFIGCSDLDSGFFTEGGVNYRGGLLLYRSDSAYKYINVINTEEYLYGVLPKEMSSSYPDEALKAQAVAARSYVAGNIDKKHKDQGFDLCTTTDCQVYGGVSSEAPSCTAAVDETKGMIVYYNGVPADTCVYGSSNGGYIEACKDIWSADLGYLQGKADPYDPQTAWTATFTRAQLQSKIDSAGYGIGTLTGVNILERTAGGSVVKLEFVGTEGSKILTKSSIRTFFGISVVKSLHFDITESEFTGQSVTKAKYCLKDSLSALESILSGLYIMDGSGNMVQIGMDSALSVMTGNGLLSLPLSTTSSEGGDDVDGIVISGKGYGHCLGMSQTGAREMAKQGFTYDQILKFYYTGVEVK